MQRTILWLKIFYVWIVRLWEQYQRPGSSLVGSCWDESTLDLVGDLFLLEPFAHNGWVYMDAMIPKPYSKIWACFTHTSQVSNQCCHIWFSRLFFRISCVEYGFNTLHYIKLSNSTLVKGLYKSSGIMYIACTNKPLVFQGLASKGFCLHSMFYMVIHASPNNH